MASHLSNMLVGVYQLGVLRQQPQVVKYLFGPDPTDLFFQLFDEVFLLMDEFWRRAEFSFAQFLQAIRNMRYISPGG